MLHYLKGLCRLCRIGFAIQGCENIYYLQGTLKLFLCAENKTFQYESRDNECAPSLRTITQPWIVSRLPQFSEALHERIRELRAEQEVQLSKYRVLRKKRVLVPCRGRSLLSLDQEAFFRNNEALLLTYPDHISGLDLKLDESEDQAPEYTQ